MRLSLSLLLLVPLFANADEPSLVIPVNPFDTLVNPNCSHCIDESKRRKSELKDDDRVLCWTRGKYEGGAIPYRFFLNPYRVISDSYGVFVYDPDAGYARGFKASYDFRFHGWRNGVMVMKHKDGTLYSCLTGLGFEGPNKGKKLEPWPTIVSDWGWVMKSYPNIVAYHMYEKYKPVELPSKVNEDSIKSQGKPDPRMPADELILGVEAPSARARPRAFRLNLGKEKYALSADRFECGNEVVVLWQADTRTAAAYFPVAEKHEAIKELSVEGKLLDTKPVQLKIDGRISAAFVDEKTGSRFDIAGRCVEGELKGWTLRAYDSVVVKWFAWAAEHRSTTIHEPKPAAKVEPKANPNDAIREVTGTAEFLRAVPKKFAIFQGFDAKTGRVKLRNENEKEAKEWPVEPDAEIKVMGWWGRLEQIPANRRVWVWFKTNRKKEPVSVFMLADEISEQDIHGDGLIVTGESKGSILAKDDKGERGVWCTVLTKRYRGKILEEMRDCPEAGRRVFAQTDGAQGLLVLDPEAFEARRALQKKWLREKWVKDGLPGTVSFVHLSGEADLMLDHETMRWARSLKTGDKVKIAADPPIEAVVKSANAWRERTQVRIVINGVDLAGLSIGQRINLLMIAPAAEIENDIYPSDIDKPKTKEERLEWFLANIYCTCPIAGDNCTGDFYTLSSCNPNGCAGPNSTRKKIAAKIDAGLGNRQIFDDLRIERGKSLLRPHLAP